MEARPLSARGRPPAKDLAARIQREVAAQVPAALQEIVEQIATLLQQPLQQHVDQAAKLAAERTVLEQQFKLAEGTGRFPATLLQAADGLCRPFPAEGCYGKGSESAGPLRSFSPSPSEEEGCHGKDAKAADPLRSFFCPSPSAITSDIHELAQQLQDLARQQQKSLQDLFKVLDEGRDDVRLLVPRLSKARSEDKDDASCGSEDADSCAGRSPAVVKRTCECTILRFRTSYSELKEALQADPLAEELASDNFETRPIWANDATILVSGLTAESMAEGGFPPHELSHYHVVVPSCKVRDLMDRLTRHKVGYRKRFRLRGSKTTTCSFVVEDQQGSSGVFEECAKGICPRGEPLGQQRALQERNTFLDRPPSLSELSISTRSDYTRSSGDRPDVYATSSKRQVGRGRGCKMGGTLPS